MSSSSSSRLYLFAYCLVLFLIFLGNVPLIDPDEPVYGATAKEMLATGDFLSPRIYGQYWYDKPPLFYWLEALSFSILGVSAFSARLPSALIAAFTVLYVWHVTEKTFNRRVAWLAACILASSLEFIVLARAAVTDMTLTAALTVALFSFLRKRYMMAYIACGIAFLTKGPIGFGLPALIVFFWLLVQKKLTPRHIMNLKWTWGILLACVVGLPWYIYMIYVHGQPFIDSFLVYHNVVKFTSPEHPGKNHWWLYLVVLTAGCFPWTGAVAAMLTRVRRFARDPRTLYLVVWAAVIFLFFSFSATQLFSYVLPMFPALAVLTALYLDQAFGEERFPLPRLHLFFIALVAGAVALAPLEPTGGEAARYGIVFVMLLLGLMGTRLSRARRAVPFVLVQCLLSLVFTASVWFFYAEPVREYFTSGYLSARAEATDMTEGIPFYMDPFYRPASAFYHDVYALPMPDLKRPSARISGDAYLLVQKKTFRRWPKEQRAQWRLLWETPTAGFFRKF